MHRTMPAIKQGFDVFPALETHYLLSANVSGIFSAPNWTVMHPPNSTLPSYYILPFVIPENRDLSTATNTTAALGTSVSCKIFSQSKTGRSATPLDTNTRWTTTHCPSRRLTRTLVFYPLTTTVGLRFAKLESAPIHGTHLAGMY